MIKSLLQNKLVIQSIWLFLFLNNISFVFAPSVTTTRIVAVFSLLLIITLGLLRKIEGKQLYFILFCIILGVINYLVSLFGGGDATQFSRLIHFSLYSIAGATIYYCLYQDEVTFHKAVVIATLIQVIFVFVTYSSSTVNNIIFNYVYITHNFLENLGRAPGLSSLGGAALSLIISLGAFSVVRLSMLEKKNWYIPCLFLIAFSQVLVGRTGLLLTLFAFILLLIYSKVNLKTLVLSVLALIICQIILLDYIAANEQFYAYTMKWAESSLTGDDGTISALLNMKVREMDTLSLIIGTGQVTMANGLNASGSDVGYIQAFYAMGISAVVFYLMLFIFLYSFYKKTRRNLFYKVLLFLPFIVELKEPFIFKYMVVFYVFIVLIYGSKHGEKVDS